ncbi:hypothetical protein RI367_004650 [Sorochytrium milnesiophthora]
MTRKSAAVDSAVLAYLETGSSSVRVKALSGGCINDAVKLTVDGSGATYFLKTSSASNAAEMFASEAYSLRLLGQRVSRFGGKVPQPLAFGRCQQDASRAYLLCEWLDMTACDERHQRQLAQVLAGMHKEDSGQTRFGFDVTTMCGSTAQDNTWTDSWIEFFMNRRIGALVQKLEDDKQLQQLNEQLQKVAAKFFPDTLHVRPTLLHGDLWSGNWGSSDRPVLFDPACYYGHYEAELSIMQLFGGFSLAFWSTYHAHMPKEQPHFSQRQQLYTLYHQLNHYCMFGRGYRAQCLESIRQLIAAGGSGSQ